MSGRLMREHIMGGQVISEGRGKFSVPSNITWTMRTHEIDVTV